MPERREKWIPRQRPREQWEHVYVKANGVRYVDVDELMASEKVKAMKAKFRDLGSKVGGSKESPNRGARVARPVDDFAEAHRRAMEGVDLDHADEPVRQSSSVGLER